MVVLRSCGDIQDCCTTVFHVHFDFEEEKLRSTECECVNLHGSRLTLLCLTLLCFQQDIVDMLVGRKRVQV